MTESSTITTVQELTNRLGTQHPGKQMLLLLDRIEKLEKGMPRVSEVAVEPPKKMGRPKGSKNKE